MANTSTNISNYLLERNPSANTNVASTMGNIFYSDSTIPFYRIATVVDIIVDDKHPFFGKNLKNPDYINSTTVSTQQIPANYKNNIPDPRDLDYSYIGRAKIRFDSEKNISEESFSWAIPLDSTITQYPLLNEQVLIMKISGNYYYTKPFNCFNYGSTNVNFTNERRLNPKYSTASPFEPDPLRKSYTSHPLLKNQAGIGYLGSYFILNPYIRNVKKFEGDTVIESRFGQSIRFTAYDDNRKNDNGGNRYSSYKVDDLFDQSTNGGYGNPRIVIRNRQRNIAKDSVQSGVHRKLPKIEAIKDFEKNYGGQIEEDINNDGSTIEISSGIIKTKWISSVYKSIFIENNEEQTGFSPNGCTKFKFPTLDGDQIVINTDRLILSSRLQETLHFSKKRYGIVTDSEYTVDANDQIVMTTNALTCLNSPLIYLGQYGENNEPALLGQTTVDWLYDLCNWLLDHVHWYHHVHPHPHVHEDAGLWDKLYTQDANPDQTQISVQQIRLKLLRDSLHRTLSRRVFLTGGGYAEGRNGVKPKGSEGDCKEPIVINMVNGMGGITAFKGRNRREGPLKTIFKYENEPKDLVGLQEKINKLESLPNVTSLSQSDQLKDIYKKPINEWVDSIDNQEAKLLLSDPGISRLMNSKGTLDPLTKKYG